MPVSGDNLSHHRDPRMCVRSEYAPESRGRQRFLDETLGELDPKVVAVVHEDVVGVGRAPGLVGRHLRHQRVHLIRAQLRSPEVEHHLRCQGRKRQEHKTSATVRSRQHGKSPSPLQHGKSPTRFEGKGATCTLGVSFIISSMTVTGRTSTPVEKPISWP